MNRGHYKLISYLCHYNTQIITFKERILQEKLETQSQACAQDLTVYLSCRAYLTYRSGVMQAMIRRSTEETAPLTCKYNLGYCLLHSLELAGVTFSREEGQRTREGLPARQVCCEVGYACGILEGFAFQHSPFFKQFSFAKEEYNRYVLQPLTLVFIQRIHTGYVT